MVLAIPCIVCTTVACSMQNNLAVRDVPVNTTPLSLDEQIMQIFNALLNAYGFPSMQGGPSFIATPGSASGSGPKSLSGPMLASNSAGQQLDNGANSYSFSASTSWGMHNGGVLGFGLLPSLPFFQFSTESNNMSRLGALSQVLSFSTKIPGGLLATIMQLVPDGLGGFLGGLLGSIMGGQGIGGGLIQGVVTGAIIGAVTSAISGSGSSSSGSTAAKVEGFLSNYEGYAIDEELIEAVIDIVLNCDDCLTFEEMEQNATPVEICAGFTFVFGDITDHIQQCDECKLPEVNIPEEICQGIIDLIGNEFMDINLDTVNDITAIDDSKIEAVIAHIEGCNFCSPPASTGVFCSEYETKLENLENHLKDCDTCKNAKEEDFIPTSGLCGYDNCLTYEENMDLVSVVIKALTQSAVDQGGDVEMFLDEVSKMMEANHQKFMQDMADEYFGGDSRLDINAAVTSFGTASGATRTSSLVLPVSITPVSNTGVIGNVANNFVNNVVARAGLAGIGNGALLSSIAGGALTSLFDSVLPFGANIALNNILNLLRGDGLSIGAIIQSLLPIPRITRNGEEFSLTLGPLAGIKLNVKRSYPSWCSKPAIGAQDAFPHRCVQRPLEVSMRSIVKTLGGFKAIPSIAGTSLQLGAITPSVACIDTLCSSLNPLSDKHCMAWHIAQCTCNCVFYDPTGMVPPVPNPWRILPPSFGVGPCTVPEAIVHNLAAQACYKAGQIPTRKFNPLQPGPCCRATNNGTMGTGGGTGMGIEASAWLDIPGVSNWMTRFAMESVRGDWTLFRNKESMFSDFKISIESRSNASGA